MHVEVYITRNDYRSRRMVSLVPVEDNTGDAGAGTSTSDELPPDQQIPKLQQQINRQFATDNYKAAGSFN